MKDYYKILGVSENASERDIKSAYRRLAFRYHPDTNPGNEKEAEAKFKKINEAYCVLGDKVRRRQYDATAAATRAFRTPSRIYSGVCSPVRQPLMVCRGCLLKLGLDLTRTSLTGCFLGARALPSIPLPAPVVRGRGTTDSLAALFTSQPASLPTGRV